MGFIFVHVFELSYIQASEESKEQALTVHSNSRSKPDFCQVPWILNIFVES